MKQIYTAENETSKYSLNLKAIMETRKIDTDMSFRLKNLSCVFFQIDKEVWETVLNDLLEEKKNYTTIVKNSEYIRAYFDRMPTLEQYVEKVKRLSCDQDPKIAENMYDKALKHWQSQRTSYAQLALLDRLEKAIELWRSGTTVKEVNIPKKWLKTDPKYTR